MLTKGDDYPLHQTAEPIAYAGTDRNFYDRYFFSGYALEGDRMFGLAFGVYPHLNIADASFCVVRDGVETALHASRWLGMERMDLTVGPIRIEVLKPLQKLKIVVDAPDQRLRAEIVFEARHFPIEEPRFTRRIGPRTFMDYTRLTQNGRYDGWIELDDVREPVSGFVGTRDRSWGIRPVGARGRAGHRAPNLAAILLALDALQFRGWEPLFPHQRRCGGRALEPACGLGARWRRRGGTVSFYKVELRDTMGLGHPQRSLWSAPALGRGGRVASGVQASLRFSHARSRLRPSQVGHGVNQGELTVEREDIVLAEVDPKLPQHLHVQAFCEVTMRSADGRERNGRGLLEQLAFGPHAPSRFKSMLDMAQ